MKQPRRLLADTHDPVDRELLKAWQKNGPTKAGRERAWAALAPEVGLAAGTVATATHAGAGAKVLVPVKAAATSAVTAAAPVVAPVAVTTKVAMWAVAPLVKWVVIASVASGALATAVVVTAPAPRAMPGSRAREEPIIAPARAPEVARVAVPPVPDVPAAPLKRPVSAARATPPAPPVLAAAATSTPAAVPIAAAVPADHLIAQQVASLDDARRALDVGEAPRALGLLDDFDARFPDGALSEEATVLRVKALLAAGRRGDAIVAGERFVDRHPSSPYSTKIHEVLEAK